MTALKLHLGPFDLGNLELLQSGFRWLVPDGHECRAGEPIAYCNIAVVGSKTPSPFSDEQRDFQVALAPRVAGRLTHSPNASLGGDIDLLTTFRWREDFELGRLEPTHAAVIEGDGAGELVPVFVAGKRISELVEMRSGLGTGWHQTTRAWWGEDGIPSTLLSLATCEQYGIFSGRSGGFLDCFRAIEGPAHLVMMQDEPLVPNVRVVLEHATRTEADRAAIAADFAQSFRPDPITGRPDDWIFGGALLAALTSNPFATSYSVLTRSGLVQAPAASAIFLTLGSEFSPVGQHRRLGYTLCFHGFRMGQVGSGIASWVRSNFTAVQRSVDDIRRDYLALLDHLRRTSGARLIVLNGNTTPAHEWNATYAGHPAPLGTTLAGVRARELTLMLTDLSREHALDLIDADALLAEHGLRDHLPDGTHFSGQMHDLFRDAVFRRLREANIPGFGLRTPA